MCGAQALMNIARKPYRNAHRRFRQMKFSFMHKKALLV